MSELISDDDPENVTIISATIVFSSCALLSKRPLRQGFSQCVVVCVLSCYIPIDLSKTCVLYPSVCRVCSFIRVC